VNTVVYVLCRPTVGGGGWAAKVGERERELGGGWGVNLNDRARKLAAETHNLPILQVFLQLTSFPYPPSLSAPLLPLL
jgi:hypothetical protein